MKDIWIDRMVVMVVGAVALFGGASITILGVLENPIPPPLSVITASAVAALVGWIARHQVTKSNEQDKNEKH